MTVKNNTSEHVDYLKELYGNIVNSSESTRFEKLLYENALNKLNNGMLPTKIEDWTVKVEKLWRKMI